VSLCVHLRLSVVSAGTLYLCLSASVRSFGREPSSAPIRDFDREPFISSVPAIIITSHTTFLFPKQTHLLFRHSFRDRNLSHHHYLPAALLHPSQLYSPRTFRARRTRSCTFCIHPVACCIRVIRTASQLMFAITHTLPHHISFDSLHIPSIPFKRGHVYLFSRSPKVTTLVLRSKMPSGYPEEFLRLSQ
jgi:hypothetical protein